MNTSRKVLALTLVALSSLLAPITHAQFTLVQTGGTFRTDAVNLARPANGGNAIGQDELNFGIHLISKINDGVYGNASSWIGLADYSSWVGVYFSAPTALASFAFGRDNTGDQTSRAAGPAWIPHTIQYTTATITSAASAAAATWTTIGSMNYTIAPPDSPSLRHLYDLATPLTGVTGFRIEAASGMGWGVAIDEIELYATAAAIPEPSTYAALAGLGALGLVLWRRRRAATA
jgi:hypothetical protein